MTTVNPLTAGSELARASVQTNRAENTAVNEESANAEDKRQFGEFTRDVVEISRLGQERLQKENQIEASRQIDQVANDVIRISSTIGRNKSEGNLTSQQATELYNKIASLL